MIVHVNHLERGWGAAASEPAAALLAIVEQSGLESRALESLHLHLDWIQYRSNFREPVTVRRAVDGDGRLLPLAEVAVDLRQSRGATADHAGPASGFTGGDAVRRALASLAAEPAVEDAPVYLEEWRALHDSVIWPLNDLFWQRLSDWEAATGRGFEQALPSGRSDANHPDAVGDSVGEFWTLLRELDKHGQLPPEVFALEIGVGTGARAALWLDRFRTLDEARGTGYYPRIRFLLGDYSMPTLDRALSMLDRHREAVSVLALDAQNPLKTLSFLRYKILYVHLTNVYDNLPVDELVRRDGRLYLVETRAYVPRDAAARLAAEHDLAPDDLPRTVDRLLEAGPEAIADRARGTRLWQAIWSSVRLAERLRALEGVAEVPVPPGMRHEHIEELLEGAPDDVRFHLSRGAVASFINTLPLLHPRGYLQVQDIFVTAMGEYRHGFRGPGKLDGAIVNWVNGALLQVVAARAGYDVHFAPFRYRPGSRTSILYTTQRD
jgi:hypothetical protein